MSTEWNSTSGGNWTTSGDWTSGVPTSATDAIIGVAGGYTVTLNGESGQANSLTISDASATLSIGVQSGAGSLAIAGTLSNSGTLEIDNGGGSVGSVLSVGGGLANTGTIDLGAGFGAGNSSLTVAGTLTNSGTLTIDDDVASATVVSAGALVDGGIVAGEGAIHLNGAGGGMAELIVATGSAPGTLTTSTTLFGSSLLEYASGQITSIAGSGELIVGGGKSFVADAGAATSESALTALSSVAGDFELQSGGALSLSGGLAVTGHLNIDNEGGAVGSLLSVGSLTNSGTIDLGAGFGAGNSSLTVAGTLTNSGTLTIDDDVTSATVVSAGALVNGGVQAGDGTINLNGAGGGMAELIVATGSAPGALTTSTTLFGSSLLEYASGQITSIAGSGELIVGGGQSFVADAGAATSESALTVLSSVAGDFELQSGGALALSGGLAVTGHLNIDNEGGAVGSVLSVGSLTNSGAIDLGAGNGAGDSSLTVAGTLTNSGTLSIDDHVTSATVVSAGALANTGTITLNGAGGGAAELIVAAGSAPGALTTSTTLFGSSLLEYASGQITSVASGGELIVGGGQSFVADAGATTSESALTTLSSVAGDFELQSGGALSLSGGLAVTGHLAIDNEGGAVGSVLSVGSLTNSGAIDLGAGNGAGDSSLTVAGTLTNSGTLSIDDHVVSATVVSAGALADTGTISLNGASFGAAELIVASGSAPGTLTTSITLFGSSLLEYASGQITSVASGGELIVGGGQAFVADAGAATSESALTALSSVAGDFELQSGGALSLSGGLAVTGHLNIDNEGGAVGSVLSVGSLTNSGAIDLGAGNGAGDSSLTVAGTLTNSGTLTIDDHVTSATVVSAGALANTGTIGLDGAGLGAAELVISGALSDTGSITLTGSALLSAGGGLTVTSGGSVSVASGGTTGNVIVGAGGTLDLLSGGVVSGGISFSGSGGQLKIGGTAMPTNTISGFVPGDSFDLANIALDKTSGSASLGANNQLQITEGGTTYDLNLNPSESFTGDTFQLAPDTGSGTLVIENNTPCYCRGTLLLTERGEAAVENLAIGDRVVTVAGAAKPIKWIGRRSYQGRFVAGSRSILPVCVKAGALADGVPRRDLWVSPNHALYLEGVLIEARDLINGVSIVQAKQVAAVEYFHIELDSHDLLVAEGAAAESFLDDDNRLLFHNAHEYRALHLDASAGPARYCVPRCDAGWEVERARTAIARRAGLAVTAEGPAVGALRGRIEAVGRRRIKGWAQDAAHPEAPVCLDILAGGELIGQVAANRYRADLMAAGLGSGRHGFEFVPPPGLAFAPRSVVVRRALDGASLASLRRPAAGSPRPSAAKG